MLFTSNWAAPSCLLIYFFAIIIILSRVSNKQQAVRTMTIKCFKSIKYTTHDTKSIFLCLLEIFYHNTQLVTRQQEQQARLCSDVTVSSTVFCCFFLFKYFLDNSSQWNFSFVCVFVLWFDIDVSIFSIHMKIVTNAFNYLKWCYYSHKFLIYFFFVYLTLNKMSKHLFYFLD